MLDEVEARVSWPASSGAAPRKALSAAVSAGFCADAATVAIIKAIAERFMKHLKETTSSGFRGASP
jgi:hypothetical protein